MAVPVMQSERPSTIWGAGFQNCVHVPDPAAGGHTRDVVLYGGDTAGTSISFDDGYTIRSANHGRDANHHKNIIAIHADRITANKVWSYSSNFTGAVGSATLASVHIGTIDPVAKTLEWTFLCDNSTTSLSYAKGGGDSHPRQTGQLLIPDPFTANRAYIGTQNGVYLVTGNTKGAGVGVSKARAGSVIWGMAIDPQSTAGNVILYTTSKNDGGGGDPLVTSTFVGVSMISGIGAGQSQTITGLTGTNSPTAPEGIAAVNEGGTTVLYVADGLNGIKRYNGTSWTDITPAAAVAGTRFHSIDAVRVGTATRVMAGHDGDNLTGAKIWSSDNAQVASPTWTGNADGDVDLTILNSAWTWWLTDKKPFYALKSSQGGFDAAQIVFRRDATGVNFVCGRSAVYRKDRSQFSGKWRPAINGLSATVSYSMHVDPTNSARVAEADVDWSAILSSSKFSDKPVLAQPATGTSRGMTFFEDGSLFVGLHERDTLTLGEVWSNPAPFTGGTWVNQGLQAFVGSNQVAVRGVAVGRANDGQVVIYAQAVSNTTGNGGLYRKKATAATIAAGNGTWTRINNMGEGLSSSWPRTAIRWAGNDTAYAYMPDSGLWRSTNAAAASPTWTNIWPIIASNLYTRYACDLVVDPDIPTRLYLTLPGKVWKINNANNGTLTAAGANSTGTITATDVTRSIPAPGPLAIRSGGGTGGIVYCASVTANNSSEAGLWATDDAGTTWSDISTPGYKAQQLFVLGIDVSPDGSALYSSGDGTGGHVMETTGVPVDPTTTDVVEVPTIATFEAELAKKAGIWFAAFLTTNLLTSGEQSTMPRVLANVGTQTLASGIMRVTMFTATKTATYTKLRSVTGSTVGVGMTLCKMGIYTVADDGSLTALVASTPNTTSLWTTSGAQEAATTASFTLTEGVRYAFAMLQVGSTTAPTLVGMGTGLGNSTEFTLPPRLGGVVNSLTDLPASVALASYATGFGGMYYGICVP